MTIRVTIEKCNSPLVTSDGHLYHATARRTDGFIVGDFRLTAPICDPSDSYCVSIGAALRLLRSDARERRQAAKS